MSRLLEDVIRKIQQRKDLDNLINYCIEDLYHNGPKNPTTLEILSLLKEMQPEFFSNYESKIVRLMGLFFKKNEEEVNDLYQFIMEKYKESIQDIRNGYTFTPMQNEIISGIQKYKNYSFSSPTSTGKSHIFRYLIEKAQKDVMIIVPSRALINEFYIRINEFIHDKETLILTFVDNINKKHTKKRIFILTPERARDIFKYKKEFEFEFFLFDEAQLTNEKSERGIYYDGIVRRLRTSYSNTKFIFAHPFIQNPDAQFIKNHFKLEECGNNSFTYKNTGQLFIAKEKDKFYIFGTDKDLLGNTKVLIDYDPIEKILKKDKGCVLIYTAKSRIIRREIFQTFNNYITQFCPSNPTKEMEEIIDKIKPYVLINDNYKSDFIEYLKQGIVLHHGSMPLEVRILLESFINKGYCKICFSTSTLAQGINMPFDLVYVDRFEESKKLLVRNIIGRAGRSTLDNSFDYGIVVVRNDNMSDIRKIINYEESLDTQSILDNEDIGFENQEYREAIKNEDFSDEFNLPNEAVKRIDENIKIEDAIKTIKKHINNNDMNQIVSESFNVIFKEVLLPKRELSKLETEVLNEANRFMKFRYLGIKFSQLCAIIYTYALKTKSIYYKYGFVLKFFHIPNLKQKFICNLFDKNEEPNYDSIVYNTYDFFDKLIDLKACDIYYCALIKYANKYNDESIRKIAIKLKYGTDDPKHILELRYGFSSEDFDWLDNVIDSISEDEIVFNEKIQELDSLKKERIEKYIY